VQVIQAAQGEMPFQGCVTVAAVQPRNVQRLVADGALADNWIHCLLRRLNFLKVSCKIFHHSLRIIDQTIVSVKIILDISFVDVRNFEIMPNKLNIQPAISIMSPFAKGEHADVEE